MFRIGCSRWMFNGQSQCLTRWRTRTLSSIGSKSVKSKWSNTKNSWNLNFLEPPTENDDICFMILCLNTFFRSKICTFMMETLIGTNLIGITNFNQFQQLAEIKYVFSWSSYGWGKVNQGECQFERVLRIFLNTSLRSSEKTSKWIQQARHSDCFRLLITNIHNI